MCVDAVGTLIRTVSILTAFNHIGLIHAVDRDIHHLITVEFHDRSAHRGYHFDDNYKFTMASLGGFSVWSLNRSVTC